MSRGFWIGCVKEKPPTQNWEKVGCFGKKKSPPSTPYSKLRKNRGVWIGGGKKTQMCVFLPSLALTSIPPLALCFLTIVNKVPVLNWSMFVMQTLKLLLCSLLKHYSLPVCLLLYYTLFVFEEMFGFNCCIVYQLLIAKCWKNFQFFKIAFVSKDYTLLKTIIYILVHGRTPKRVLHP